MAGPGEEVFDEGEYLGSGPMDAGAEAGDAVLVSGMVGDAGLGLRVTQGEVEGLGEGDLLWLADRYRIPRPAIELTGLVRCAAHASRASCRRESSR